MSDQPFLMGERRALPDARGNWTPLPAYSGWRPQEPKARSSWWLALGAALLVFAAIRAGL